MTYEPGDPTVPKHSKPIVAKELRETARKLIEVGMAFTGIIGVLSVLGGIALADVSKSEPSFFGNVTTHPYLATGIASALVSIMGTVVVFAGLYFAKWMVYVSIEADREEAKAMLLAMGEDDDLESNRHPPRCG